MANERPGATLQPTMLVHDAWIKLRGQQNVNPDDRAQVVAAGANIIRRLLVDHARKRNALRRGGRGGRGGELSFDVAAGDSRLDILELHDALSAFAESFPRAGQIVELKFFGGMTGEETAEYLKISLRTVNSDWLFAKAWLYRELGHDAPDGPETEQADE